MATSKYQRKKQRSIRRSGSGRHKSVKAENAQAMRDYKTGAILDRLPKDKRAILEAVNSRIKESHKEIVDDTLYNLRLKYGNALQIDKGYLEEMMSGKFDEVTKSPIYFEDLMKEIISTARKEFKELKNINSPIHFAKNFTSGIDVWITPNNYDETVGYSESFILSYNDNVFHLSTAVSCLIVNLFVDLDKHILDFSLNVSNIKGEKAFSLLQISYIIYLMIIDKFPMEEYVYLEPKQHMIASQLGLSLERFIIMHELAHAIGGHHKVTGIDSAKLETLTDREAIAAMILTSYDKTNILQKIPYAAPLFLLCADLINQKISNIDNQNEDIMSRARPSTHPDVEERLLALGDSISQIRNLGHISSNDEELFTRFSLKSRNLFDEIKRLVEKMLIDRPSNLFNS